MNLTSADIAAARACVPGAFSEPLATRLRRYAI